MLERSPDQIHLWFWEYTDEFRKRRRSAWLITEEQPQIQLRGKKPMKIEGTLEIRRSVGSTNAWQRRNEIAPGE
jgi:hypothetical protein